MERGSTELSEVVLPERVDALKKISAWHDYMPTQTHRGHIDDNLLYLERLQCCVLPLTRNRSTAIQALTKLMFFGGDYMRLVLIKCGQR